jgi:hypothetical protein
MAEFGGATILVAAATRIVADPAAAYEGKNVRGCRSPVSRILSIPCGTGRSFLSSRRSGAPHLRGVRLIPGSQRAGRPFPVLSCTTRGFQCRSGCPRRGGLLPHHFTLACVLADHRRYAFCCTVRPGSSRFPSPTFVRRVALWCPDFPQAPLARGLRPSGERHAKIARRVADSKEKFASRCLIRDPCVGHPLIWRFPSTSSSAVEQPEIFRRWRWTVGPT